MRIKDIIIGVVVTAVLVAVVVWVAISVWQHENTGQAQPATEYAAAS